MCSPTRSPVPNNANPVIVDFPYSAGSSTLDYNERASFFAPSTHALMVPANQAGTVYGLGYRRASNTVYAAAFMKKHSGFGPSGTGAIYAVDPSSGATTLFADLNAIFGAGTAGADAHAGNGGDFRRDNDNVAWDAVGKTSLGGLDVSADGSKVYVVNLANRELYELPTSGPLTPATVRHSAVPLNAPGATGGGADLRPFAVQWHAGLLYVGIVNSAQSTQSASDLRAYVYSVNPSTLAFSAAPVFQFSLAYPRGDIQLSQAGGGAAWRPWTPTFATTSPSPAALGIYPQPMLTGLSFDVEGNLVVGLRDRAGDQFGTSPWTSPAAPRSTRDCPRATPSSRRSTRRAISPADGRSRPTGRRAPSGPPGAPATTRAPAPASTSSPIATRASTTRHRVAPSSSCPASPMSCPTPSVLA